MLGSMIGVIPTETTARGRQFKKMPQYGSLLDFGGIRMGNATLKVEKYPQPSPPTFDAGFPCSVRRLHMRVTFHPVLIWNVQTFSYS